MPIFDCENTFSDLIQKYPLSIKPLFDSKKLILRRLKHRNAEFIPHTN